MSHVFWRSAVTFKDFFGYLVFLTISGRGGCRISESAIAVASRWLYCSVPGCVEGRSAAVTVVTVKTVSYFSRVAPVWMQWRVRWKPGDVYVPFIRISVPKVGVGL